MITRMVFCGSSYFGAGARNKIQDEITKRKFKKALLVSDKGLVDLGITAKIEEVLKRIKFPYELFSDIKPNPTIENVLSGVEFLQKSGADFIIAVGGGSSIDTAKAMAVVAKNPDNSDIVSLEGADKNKNPPLPIIALPTTAGTGSETTMDYVITNVQEKRKMSCMCSTGVPVAAILDTELMAGLPVKMSVAVGMDALTHAVESFIAKGANTFSRTLAKKSIELITSNLNLLIENPKNLEVRENLALASFMAGMSFTNAGLGIVHSMAHPLSAFYDVPHGIANALILPFGIKFNSDVLADFQIQELGNAFGCKETSSEKIVSEIFKKLRGISKKAEIPLSLKELGAKKEDLEKLSESAFADCATLDNPKQTSKEDFLNIYKQMF